MAALGLTGPNRAFWSGKRVLLTGHTGFKGAWTAIWLSRMGALVSGLALEPAESPNLFHLTRISHLIDHHIIDLRDFTTVRASLFQREFDIVLHMAAQAFVRASIKDPVSTIATNVMGTSHLLEALRDHSELQAILVVTSDKVYANAEDGTTFKEEDPLGGKDPYSASKAATEIVTTSFAKTFFDKAGIPLATARGGNVIGGGDYSRDRLMSDILRASMAGEAPILRHPEATRPWQHVLDCVAGYLVLTERLTTIADVPRAVNFGPRPDAPAMTVGELASRAVAGLGARPWRHEPDGTSIEARTLGIDTELARNALGFSSLLDAAAAVDWTVEWHLSFANGASARDLCEEQISRYEELR